MPVARDAAPPSRTPPSGSARGERSPYWRVRRVVLGYALFASAWILLSDRLVNLLFHDTGLMMLASSLKGLFFVLITSSLLLVTLNRAVRKLIARTAELRASESRLQLAAASASLGIWDRHVQAGIEIWNDRMWELYGLEPGPAPPSYETWLDTIVHPDDREQTGAAIRAALAGAAPYDLEFRAVLPDGQVRHIKSNAQVLRDPEGQPLRLIGINRDRTRKVEAEAEQRRLQADRQHAEKLDSIGSLAGGVAHDMNNVLAAILGVASALRGSAPGTGPEGASLDTIIRACLRGRDVVRSLLTFARKDLEASGPLDLNAIAGEMVKLLSHTTLSRIEIRTEFQEPLDLIEGEAGAMNHALLNLGINAVDAMPEGGVLELRTRQAPGGDVELSIRDTGRGMSPDLVQRAIEPFFTTKAIGKGTGLGLAMVYGTVKAHGGAFEIRSEPGLGTEVILRFPPLARAHPGPEPAPAPRMAGPAQPLRILLVDDDELIRLSVAPLLEALGHQAMTAETGQEALQRLQAGLAVDLVILDMNMPGLSGAQTLARLLELRPGQKVIMATGYSDEAITPLLRDHPSVTSLRKPFSMEELRDKLGGFAGAGSS